MKKRYFLIIILVVMFCLSIIRCSYAQTEVLEKTKLPEGLVIKSEKVKFIKVKENPACYIRSMTNWGRIIYTENPNVIALFGYTKEDKYWLKVYDMRYKLIAEFQPQSENILIPKNKDIIWVTGQGPQGGEMLTRSYWNEGLYLYDFSGKLLKTIDKKETDKIDRIKVTDNGDLYFLSLSIKDNRKKSIIKIDSKGNEIWKIPSNAHSIKVFGEGEHIISEGFIGESSNPQIHIYNSDKKVQSIISGQKGTGFRCVGMSS
ncbi:hypothetical protein KAU33_01040, partial [Candidatus Dependentiae bacterium]|nr:hypothetical protein [Candidatus Dependentiae bacterium]